MLAWWAVPVLAEPFKLTACRLIFPDQPGCGIEWVNGQYAGSRSRPDGVWMRILMTGGSGVLGRASMPFLSEAGHRIDAPRREELDLFDPAAVAFQMRGTAAVLHLAAHIPPRESQGRREAWLENDRLRREATGILVDATLAARVECFVFPSLAFIYPPSGPVDESTPLPEDVYEIGRSAVDAERHVARFCAGGGRGVVLRLGGLYGPGAESDMPVERYVAFWATLSTKDAGRAIAAALHAPAGLYNVVRDGERVTNARFKTATGWSPSDERLRPHAD